MLNCNTTANFIFKTLIKTNKLLLEKFFILTVYKVNNKILKLISTQRYYKLYINLKLIINILFF